MDRRVATATVGFLAGLLASVAAWVYFDVLFLFFFLPFVPFLFRRERGEDTADGREGRVRELRSCPVCSFETTDPDFEYCPRDGHRLEREC